MEPELGSRLVVILDQFEEYLLYHPNADDPVTIELADAIAEVDDGTNFLISIREDAVAQLDRFEGLVPSILYNTYRVEPLDRAEARGAVVGPVQHFNELHPEAALIVEDALIDEVLERVQIGRPAIEADLGQSDDRGAVEAAELQLVFERLWREAEATGSREVTLATLKRLGRGGHDSQPSDRQPRTTRPARTCDRGEGVHPTRHTIGLEDRPLGRRPRDLCAGISA